MTKILYFAWFKERVGVGEEEVEIPADLDSVTDLLDWLAGRSDGHAQALKDRAVVRVAVNQDYVQLDDELAKNAHEIAIFPPVTGG